MQEPSRIMSHENDGGVTVAVDSHDHDLGHGQSRSSADADADADAEEEEERSDRESFFQCVDRVEPSGAVHVGDADPDFPSDEDEDDDGGDDVRVSFTTAVGDRLREEQAELDDDEEEDMPRYDYGMWMAAEPMSIQERRRRLLQGMGLTSSKDLLRSRSARMRIPPDIPRCASRRQPQPPTAPAVANDAPSTATAVASVVAAAPPDIVKQQPNAVLTRCRSDSRLAVRGGAARKPPSFRRVYSVPHSLQGSPVHKALRAASRCPLPSAASKDEGEDNSSGNDIGRNFTIKNLDDGKEFVVSGQSTDGALGVLDDLQTGVQLSIHEFERFIGYTPLVKQLMHRSQSQPVPVPVGAAKGGAKPGKKKPRWLKKIKFVASAAGLIHEKDRGRDGNGGGSGRSSTVLSAVTMSKSGSANAAMASSSSSSEPLKVHHCGNSSKELTGLYMRQEVRAHEGSIWSIKFSPDGRFLASGGEDRVVRVWRVVNDDASSSGVAQELSTAQLPPPPPGVPADGGSVAPGLAAQLSKKARRGKSSKHVLPEHLVVPETVFALSEEPACAFEGHLDDVLDLSWSKSQQLLSSSMDKTVRLWDMETKACLKLFTHSDYVTCIQFNPVDDGYFISGSLDSKVRIWSVAERHVVDWSDLNDMVTAACYTPDGQAAIIGSHKGSCRFYKTVDCKLNQEAQIDMSISKKRKSQAKKITGFQFAPGNPSEILVTSADSQIRVFNGITVLQKFKGFKNTSSQISASYSADGRYVVCASEDSHVYVWRRASGPGSGAGGAGGGGGIGVKAKTWLTSRSYEHFFCRDVSAAVPWPGSPSFRWADRSPSSVHGIGKKQPSLSCAVGDVHGSMPRRPKSGPMTYPGAGGQVDLCREATSRGRHGGAEDGNAWGMVVAAASLGGEIRVYQNFGLPLKIRGQSNLFL